MEITCPSGLVGEVRGLKTKEADILAEGRSNNEAMFDNVFSNCWLKIVEPGPYNIDVNAIAFPWSKALLGDRMAVMIGIRRATFGNEYQFQVQCASCGERFMWGLDLEADIEQRTLSPSSAEFFRAGKPLVFEINGEQYEFNLMTAEIERKLKKRLKSLGKQRSVSAALTERVISITKMDGTRVLDGNDRQRYFEGLDLGVASELIRGLDEADCGIETEIEVRCGACSAVQDIELPFGRSFWNPASSRPRRS